MGRKAKLAAGATAIVAGPSGMRRFAGGCLVVLLLGVLALAAGVALIAWLGSRGGSESSALPCPPAAVQIRYTGNPPGGVRDQVAEVITASGRTVATTTDPAADDIAVAWSPGGTSYAGQRDLRVASQPTAAWLRSALGDRLSACQAASADPSAAAPKTSDQDRTSPLPGVSWPWSGGWTTTATLGVGLIAWWIAGPNVARGAVRSLWPLRLAGRRWQRTTYRWRLRRGFWPAEWPDPLPPGQRWHESPEAMTDHRTPRSQTREDEPARRAAMRAVIRQERIAGNGVGPARAWRVIYRVPDNNEAPMEGAPEMQEVSS